MIDKAKQIAEDEPLDSERWKRGSTAQFLPINSLWGIKFYKTEEEREYTWNIQNIAVNVNAAAPVGDWVDSNLGYGYLTMIADIKRKKDDQQIKGLRKKLEDIGLRAYGLRENDDSRWKNCGYFNNELVCIDFEAIWMCFLVNGGLIQKIVQSGQPVDKDIGKRLNWRYTTDKEC